jgi:hypothetical protein
MYVHALCFLTSEGVSLHYKDHSDNALLSVEALFIQKQGTNSKDKMQGS